MALLKRKSNKKCSGTETTVSGLHACRELAASAEKDQFAYKESTDECIVCNGAGRVSGTGWKHYSYSARERDAVESFHSVSGPLLLALAC